MTYKITANKIIMVIENNEVSLDYSFSDNDKTLTFIEPDGTATILKK